MNGMVDKEGMVEETSQPINYFELLSEFWKQRKFIALFTGSITLFTLIIVLLLPNNYTSTAVILPDVDKSRLGSLGGLTDIAAMAGVNVGGEGSFAKLYPTIIKSESVLKNVIYHKYKTNKFADSINLIQFWEIEMNTPEREYEIALNGLKGQLSVSSDIKLNVVTMSIETREPQLSADILNTIIVELNKFILTNRTSKASEQRKWIEKRLVDVKGDLESSENALKEFREKNRIVTGSPQLMLEQERFAREVQINTTLYVELKKQYEIARIEEIRDVPIINVMDYARPAAKKSSPKRAINTITALFISCFISILFVFINFRYKKTVNDVMDKMPLLKQIVSRAGLKTID